MFWSLVCIDRASSLVLALPETIADREISTLWPCPPAYYEDGRAFLQSNGSVETLDDLASLSRAREDNMLTLYQKAFLLLFRTSILSARAKLGDPNDMTLRHEVFMTCQATSAFANSLPEFRVQETDGEDPDVAKSTLVMAFTAAYSAVIQAHGIIPQSDPAVLEEQLQAAKRAMEIAKEVEGMHTFHIPACIAWALTPAHEFLVRERVRLVKLGRMEDAEAIQRDIQLFLRVIKRLETIFPSALTIAADVIDRNVEVVRTETVGRSVL